MKKLLNKVKNMPLAAKASIAFFIATIITSGISFITTPIYTRILPKEIYGQTSVFFTDLSIIGVLTMFGLSNGIFNNGMLEHKEDRDIFSFSLLFLSNLITVLVMFILLLIFDYIQPFLGVDKPLFILMLFIFLFQPAYNFWLARKRFEYKYKGPLIVTVFSVFLSQFFSILLICLSSEMDLLYARLFGQEIILLLFYLGFYIFLLVKSKIKIKFSYVKEAFLFNLPLIPHYLSSHILGTSDRLMIKFFEGDAATAIYSLGFTIGSLVILVWNAINSSLVPFTYENCKNKNFMSINKISNIILFLFFFTCLCVMFVAPELVIILGSKEYIDAICLIPPILCGVFFQALYYLFANVIFYFKKPVYIMIASVISAFLNVFLNYIFIPKYGYIAAAYTTLFCYFFQSCLDYIFMRCICKEKIYNVKLIILISILLIIISLFVSFLYKFVFYRYLFLVLIVFFIILFRKKIINTIKIINGGSI